MKSSKRHFTVNFLIDNNDVVDAAAVAADDDNDDFSW